MSPRRESAVMLDMPTNFETFEQSVRKPVLRGKLSSAEIEALLRPDLSDMAPEPIPPPKMVTPRPIPDLDQPLPARAGLTEDALRLAARLSLAFRQGCGLHAAATVTEASAGTFASALAPHSGEMGRAIACFAAPGGEIIAMLSLSAPLASALMGPGWFDTAVFPQAVFKSTSVTLTGDTTATVSGDLTLHGITAPIVLDATFNGAAFDRLRGNVIGFSATTQIDRTQFGVSKFSGLLANEVKIEIQAEFIKQAEAR